MTTSLWSCVSNCAHITQKGLLQGARKHFSDKSSRRKDQEPSFIISSNSAACTSANKPLFDLTSIAHETGMKLVTA